jgi:hypothetical protein
MPTIKTLGPPKITRDVGLNAKYLKDGMDNAAHASARQAANVRVNTFRVIEEIRPFTGVGGRFVTGYAIGHTFRTDRDTAQIDEIFASDQGHKLASTVVTKCPTCGK